MKTRFYPDKFKLKKFFSIEHEISSIFGVIFNKNLKSNRQKLDETSDVGARRIYEAA
ncbi:hypothetical protein [Campylobacter sp. RM9328]|uniref:hypothetical protein n=1 Tax=Campylobacter sp. RM9328 TaxID=1705720 RepID=UPI001473360C|nr:hypothetical protein [Campylobacter sp. RM9328]